MAETSSFDWTDVARAVAPLAPTLGGLIGGFIPFPGAGAAGQVIGTIIAEKFGVEKTPEAVAAAIAGNPNEVVLAKLRETTEQLKAQYSRDEAIARAHVEVERAEAELIGKSVEQVNATMRARIGHEHWFYSGWRPMAGWILDVHAFLFGALLMVAIALAIDGNPGPLSIMQETWPLVAAYFTGLAAVVGVYAWGRSRTQTEAIRASARSE